ncbi:2-oxo acid dehydrogenase subunit E2 [Gammaproteobacteria bacterium]|jgi:pyruvate dehydrogenase E2 component (dihydrolipoamide acetyltransferase)|nr:2-oxo acid dehydrogenase subunit E2 [Gammaproteobacteria bacterium]
MTEIVELRGIRGVIAKNMVKSLENTAQLTLFAEFDAYHLVAGRQALKDGGHKIGYEDLIIYILCNAIRKHPIVNSRVDGITAQSSDGVHVAIAIATDAGLIAPVLFDADSKSVFEICEYRRDLIDRAKQAKLSTKEMTQGSFTVSNLGITRVNHFTPILNYPQVALLGLGQIMNRAWVLEDGSIAARPIMGLSLTIDHRVIDGGPGGEFLTELCSALETPVDY